MGQKNCHITLEDPSDVYRPGQTLNGIVEYTFDTPQIIKEISLKFKGRGYTSWGQYEYTRYKVHYIAKQEYYETTICLIRPSSGGEMELSAGKHTYPFSFTLPNPLPSSFKGEYGYIRHTIKSTLKRPWKCNTNTEVPFTVIRPLDLNSSPGFKLPIHIHLEKHYGCFCCLSGPLVLDLYLPVSGYCSGQAIPIDVSCENGSNVHINNIRIALVKTVTYHSDLPREKIKKEKGFIAMLSLGPLAAHSSKDWKQYMQVPELPPSKLFGCRIIDLDYYIKVICEPSGFHMDSDKKQTIILGTVPIVGFDFLPPGPPPVPVQAPEASNWQSEAELPLLQSLMPMLPSDPMMPPSNLGPDPNLFPNAPYDAPPPFQGQSSMGIIHGEKNRITSTQ